MKEQLIRLLELQALDEKTHETSKFLEEAPSRIEALNEQLAKFTSMLQAEKEQLQETITWQREQEARLKEEEQQTLKTKQQLQQVRNAREFSALQRQMETTRKAVGEREEEILKLMEAIEGFKVTIAQHESQYDELKARIEADLTEIETSMAEAEARKAEAMVERQNIAAEIDGELRSTYERIAERKRPAMVDVPDATCAGCKMKVRPQLYNELFRADSLKTCPACQRIIYLHKALFPDEDGPQEPPEGI